MSLENLASVEFWSRVKPSRSQLNWNVKSMAQPTVEAQNIVSRMYAWYHRQCTTIYNQLLISTMYVWYFKKCRNRILGCIRWLWCQPVVRPRPSHTLSIGRGKPWKMKNNKNLERWKTLKTLMFFMLIILTQFYLKHVDVGTPLQENQSKDKREGIHTHQQQHCLKKIREATMCTMHHRNWY